MRPLNIVSLWTNRIACGLMIVTVAVMLVMTGGQVLLRYVFHASLHWSQELVSYLFVYVGFVGGSIAFREKSHLAVDLVSGALERLSRWYNSIFRILVHVLTLFALSFVAYYGITLCISNAATRSVAMGINMAVPYAAIPLGTVLMIVHQLAQIESEIFGAGSSAADDGASGGAPADGGRT